MNKTVINIKALYEEFGNSEKKVADWVIAHPNEILPISISELAEKSSSSEATIVRFSKKLGFSGFQDFKISFASYSAAEPTNPNISKSDRCIDIFSKVANDIYVSLEKTKNSIDKDAFENASEAIANARRVVIFGLGSSSSVALDAAHKFMRTGINAMSYSDNHLQVIAASQLSKKDVAIGISHSGSSVDVVDALRIAQQNGATTISISGTKKSPITRVSDISLCTVADETKYSILALNSRIVQLAIVDSLYFSIILKHDKQSLEAIKATENSLKKKKY